MKGKNFFLPFGLFLYGLVVVLLTSRASSSKHSQSNASRKSYIVYMGDLPSDRTSASLLHSDLLQDVLGSEFTTKTVKNTYTRSFNGFVADFTEEEAQKMAGKNGVVSVFPNEKKELHTTKSWDFIGFSQQVQRAASESDVIIAVLDTGIWPESESFNDKGLGPPPSKWKGSCQVGADNFTCNNKIIGAKYYRSNKFFEPEEIQSPRDSDGHGTHTASIAAGKSINGANLYGYGSGTARGGVPSARIAAYKICWLDSCEDADILAAFDDAISDGVDVISISVGGPTDDYFTDPISIGAFHAMKNGILTVTSAGNNGPDNTTISNISPWSISVAASTMGRKFSTKVQLGNNDIYEGTSINTFDLKNKMFPMIYGGDAPNITAGATGSISRYCFRNSLDQKLVKGKIVLCDMRGTGRGPFLAGAAGTVMQEPGLIDYGTSFPLPASCFDEVGGSKIYQYMNSTRSPTATISRSTEVNDPLAPYIASFSSRGPNPITSDILKPDISAPGVHILAAWSPISPISLVAGDNRLVPFNIISGTSMSCPHVSAAAAYIKSFHPKWSPASIKSALMTTASPMHPNINSDAAEFAYGSGHLNPIKAINPGLLYDAEEIDYVKFLCGQGYTASTLQLITNDSATCSEATIETVWDLNYPSFALSTLLHKTISQTYQRKVTNVGSPMSIYKAKVIVPTGAALKIQVNPNVLSFTSLEQKLSFVLRIEGKIDKPMVSASLEWDDGIHKVTSPIVIFAP